MQSTLSQNALWQKNREYEIGRDTSLKNAIKRAQDSITGRYTSALLRFGLDWKTDKNEIIKTLTDSVSKLHALNISFPDLSISEITSSRSKDSITFNLRILNKGKRASNLTISCMAFIGNYNVYLPLDKKPKLFLTGVDLSNDQQISNDLIYTIAYYNVYYFILFVSYDDEIGKGHNTNWLYKAITKSNTWGQPIPNERDNINKYLKDNPKIYKELKF
jgi:hypothetical protein